ncbi:MAG: transposase [Candidatus Sericytochromatia bacterium]|nr:transposase [Candidatus Sericytochromatia bacterium]
MAGKFEGLTDEQWEYIRYFLPAEPEKRGQGMPHAPFRCKFNTIAYVAIIGCRGCDIPTGEQWGKRTTSHRWLGKWVNDGTWDRIKAHLLGAAELADAIDWDRASVDGSFSPWKSRG